MVFITTAANLPDGVFVLGITNVAKGTITAKASVFFWSALGVKRIVIVNATGQTLIEDTEMSMLNQTGMERG